MQLSYAMSDIPNLDDDTAMNKTLKQLQSFMQPREPLITIHRSISISSLSQTVFVLDRTQSRLAEEFRNLADMIERGFSHRLLQTYETLRTDDEQEH